MNKIVCNLCGTSYPENAAQCPICGYARSAETSAEETGNSTYTYIKGGRFSKANVKKRNKAAGIVPEKAGKAMPEENEKRGSTGLTVVIIVLLLAIVAVLGYIALRFFIPGISLFDKPESSLQETPPAIENVQEETPTEETGETEPDLSCVAVTLSDAQLNFTDAGESATITVTLDPVDTTDALIFSSSDSSVATVSKDGIVKAVGEGSAVITVSCGSVTTECTVTCIFPTEDTDDVKISLNRKEITFNTEGQSWVLYDGEISASEIIWSSDDNKVATIENGKVVAVGSGDTTVNATYNNQTVSCVIHCNFKSGDNTGSGNISEATGEGDNSYKLYNPIGYADDVTINIGDSFPLQLVDEDGNKVNDAEWNVKNDAICSFENNTVKALAAGYTEITATYNDTVYTCIVRVQ